MPCFADPDYDYKNDMKRFTPKSLVVFAIAVLILVGGAIAMLAAKPGVPDKTKVATPRPALTVTTARPAETQLPIRLMANGNIAAWQEASISSESNGLRLSEVFVNVGDKVTAGQVLATFAGDTVRAEVAQARASLQEAEANAADAAENAARGRQLKESGAISAQQASQYFTGEETAKAKVAAARAMLDAQALRLKQVRVVAPDDGIISERKATVGVVANPGTELFRMIRKGRLEWRAEVTATELGQLRIGTGALVIAANGTEINGKVRMIAPTVDPQNRSALVYVDLHPVRQDAAPARAGMHARGEFDLGTSRALTVPQQAVVMREAFSYVFRMNADGRVTQIKIQTGRRVGDRVEVLEGLPADAVVVVAGAGFLNDGDLVRVGAEHRPAVGGVQPVSLGR